jgi:hypothetical protein
MILLRPILFFCFSFFFFPLLAIEERNQFPFYHIQSDSATIQIQNRFVELCRAETSRIFSSNNAKQFECYNRVGNLDEIVSKSSGRHKIKKEIVLLFFNKTGKVYKPTFKVDSKEYKLESIIYNKNEKKAFLELSGKDSSYYLFSVDATKVVFSE